MAGEPTGAVALRPPAAVVRLPGRGAGRRTDVVCLAADGRTHIAKVPTTKRHIVDGILEGARQVLELAGAAPGEVERFIHSTTIATNAILEHKGAVCALLTTAGSEELHDSLRRLSEQKPMVIVVDGLAASGGYIAALAADHIVAGETSLVGSIGVLFQYPNFSEALKMLGIQVEEIKSSPLKAAPNGFEPTSPER